MRETHPKMIDPRQFLRYAFVGAVGTAVHYATLIALVQWLAASPTLASTLGAILGGVTNYLLNYHVTFRSGASHVEASPRFLVVALLGLLVNGVLVNTLTRHLGMHYLAAQVVATLAVLLTGFVANRSWTFKDGRS